MKTLHIVRLPLSTQNMGMPSTLHRRVNHSQTLATCLALVGGGLGLHRFYLYGFKDLFGWLFVPPTLTGLYGIWRMRELGMDDRLAWVLAPVLGLSLSAAMLAAIVYGLTASERWGPNRDNAQVWESPWLRVTGAVVALMIGSTVLITTIAFSAQRFFEW
jgi:hypothetical protein